MDRSTTMPRDSTLRAKRVQALRRDELGHLAGLHDHLKRNGYQLHKNRRGGFWEILRSPRLERLGGRAEQ